MKENEFFHQLGLLLKADMPLPESIKSLAEAETKDKAHFNEIQQAVETGLPLSKALKKTERYSEEIILLIEMAEENDTLDETLMEISKHGYFQRLIRRRARDILIYPFITLSACFLFFGIICYNYIYAFESIYGDLFDGEPMPGWTEFAVGVGAFVRDNAVLYFSLIGIAAFLFILIFSGRLKSRLLERVFIKIACLWTKVPEYYNSSRLCSYLAVHLKNGADLPKIFRSVTPVISTPVLQMELKKAAANLENGMSRSDAIAKMHCTDPLIKHCLKFPYDKDMSVELEELSKMFYERGYLLTSKLVLVWEIILILFISVIVLGIAVATFMPFIHLTTCC